MKIPFCGQTYSDKTLNANAQRTVNLYPFESPSVDDPKRIIMYPTPNYYLARAAIGGMFRGSITINNNLYYIIGNTFYQFTPNNSAGFAQLTKGTVTALGTLNSTTGTCSIVTNTVQIVISDDLAGYTYNLSSTAFAQIGTSGAFPTTGVTNLTYQDSFVIAAVKNSNQVIISNALDATVWNALSVDGIFSYPDNIVGVFSDGLQLYVLGPKFTEVQYDAGTFPYPFARTQGVLIKAGLAALNSICLVGNTVAFLASDLAGKAYVAVLVGYATKPISNPTINEQFERYSKISDAFSYTYREGDSQFYVITFPTVGKTWAVDIKTEQWHERQYQGGADLPVNYVTWNGQHVVADGVGNIYLMSQDYPPTNETFSSVIVPSPRIRTSQTIQSDSTTFLDEIYISHEGGTLDEYMQSYGTAISNYSGDNPPLATLEVSKDGGHNWHNVGTVSMGSAGAYGARLIWRNLGRFRNYLTLRLTITEPVRVYLLGAYAKAKKGNK